jgi:hypothetical protein
MENMTRKARILGEDIQEGAHNLYEKVKAPFTKDEKKEDDQKKHKDASEDGDDDDQDEHKDASKDDDQNEDKEASEDAQ